MIEFLLNSHLVTTDHRESTVLLDYLRRDLGLYGTKEGCREGDCGACTVLLGSWDDSGPRYQAVNSCLLPLSRLHGRHVVTIEGLNQKALSPIQLAMVEEGGTQCGFCTPGFILSLTGYVLSGEPLTINGAITALSGNICRCTGYHGILRAVKRILSLLPTDVPPSLETLIEVRMIPENFREVPDSLRAIHVSEPDSPQNGTSKVVAGGTDLYVTQWKNLIRNDIRPTSSLAIPEGIREEEGNITIGAATSIEEFRSSPVIIHRLPTLEHKLLLFGSQHIRHMATVGGNIINASPIGDLTCILLSLNARVHLRGKEHRSLVLREFFLDYKTLDLRTDEVLTEVSFPLPPPGCRLNFEKVSKRVNLDIASVNTSMWLTISKDRITEVGLAAGGVAPFPLFLTKTCALMRGEAITEALVRAAVACARSECTPISDVRGSQEYKRLLLGQLILAHFLAIAPERIPETCRV